MSRIFDALQRAEAVVRGELPELPEVSRKLPKSDLRVVSVTCNKGGVGKTTVATNLAVYARAMREQLSVLLFGFDDQTTLDRMFARADAQEQDTILTGLREGALAGVWRDAEYGIRYIPSCTDVAALRRSLVGPAQLRPILESTLQNGLVVIDTKSDFEVLTQAAIEASDLVIVPVKDQSSLWEARRVYDLLADLGRPRETARVLLSLVDLRVKYREGEDVDVLAHLISEIRRAGYPLFETFLSRSPKVESLHTNPQGRSLPVLHGAPHSVADHQLRSLTDEVLALVA